MKNQDLGSTAPSEQAEQAEQAAQSAEDKATVEEASRKPKKPDEYRLIPIEAISTEVNNHRGAMDKVKFKELVDSIREHGLKEPIKVSTRIMRGFEYVLVYGHRRFAAFKELRIEQIPATVAEGMTDEEIKLEQRIENMHREDLSPIDEANIVKDMMYDGAKLEVVARRLNKSITWARERLDLLRIDKKFHPLIASGRVPLKHALMIARVGDPSEQKELVESVTDDFRNESGDYVVPLNELRAQISRMLCKLGSAPWPKDVGYAGKVPCIGCPDNTNSEPTLFEGLEIALTSSKGNCTNPGCFETKMKAWEKDPEKKRREKEREEQKKQAEKEGKAKPKKADSGDTDRKKIEELQKNFPSTPEQKFAVAMHQYAVTMSQHILKAAKERHLEDVEAVILAVSAANNSREKPETAARVAAEAKNGGLAYKFIANALNDTSVVGITEMMKARIGYQGEEDGVKPLHKSLQRAILVGESLCRRWKIEMPKKPKEGEFTSPESSPREARGEATKGPVEAKHKRGRPRASELEKIRNGRKKK